VQYSFGWETHSITIDAFDFHAPLASDNQDEHGVFSNAAQIHYDELVDA
jgi:hypothetical protein